MFICTFLIKISNDHHFYMGQSRSIIRHFNFFSNMPFILVSNMHALFPAAKKYFRIGVLQLGKEITMTAKHVLLGIGVLLCLFVLASLILLFLVIFTPDSTTAIEATTQTASAHWLAAAPNPVYFLK